MKGEPDFHTSVRAVAQELIREIISKIESDYVKAHMSKAFEKVLHEQEERSL